jgi:L-ribulose-5-phosphate 3-epimerase
MQLALSSWSFHTPLYGGEMRLWDVPGEARVLGFSQVELQDLFLWPYGSRLFRAIRRFTNPPSPAPDGRFYDPPLLRRVREALAHYGSTLAAWDADPDLGRPETRDRDREYVRLALRAARQLGAPLLRITIDHRAAGQHISDTIESLAVLAVDAEREGVRLALENHGREEMDAAQLLGFVQGVNSPWLGICLDFGNFRPGCGDDDFELLARRAIHAHAKSHAFDGNGEETTIPFRHRLGVLKSIGYEGVITVEYEGDGDAAEGIRRTRRLIERHW